MRQKQRLEKSLSKSKVLKGLQCEKALFFDLNSPDLGREHSAAELQRFKTGHEVGEEAQKRYPGGTLIDAPPYDKQLAVSQTMEAIDSGATTIYEASFLHDGVFVKIDILNLGPKGWDIIEVKSTNSVKKQHVLDLAIQAWVFMFQGLEVGECYLMHLNRNCKFPKLENLFVLKNLTQKTEEILRKTEEQILRMKKVSKKTVAPPVKIGPHCNSPYECPYKGHCWKDVPEFNVFQLPGLSEKKAWEWFCSGRTKILDLNPGDFEGEKIPRAIDVTGSGRRWVNPSAIKREISRWEWPLYFFDFETIGNAIPKHKGLTPYAQTPYQFSCHVWRAPESVVLEHFEYLHLEDTDPREGLTNAILSGFGDKGSIVAYNMHFEKNVLLNLAKYAPSSKQSLEELTWRLVDPLPIFRAAVYDKNFKGSFSIKYVAPAILGKSRGYEDMDVGAGQDAGAVYQDLISGKISDKDREKSVQALLDYCRQDTYVMFELVKWLFNQT